MGSHADVVERDEVDDSPQERARRAKTRAAEAQARIRKLHERGPAADAETLAGAIDAAQTAADLAARGYLRAAKAKQRAAEVHDRLADTLERRANSLRPDQADERDELLRRADQHRHDAAEDRAESQHDQALAQELNDRD